MSQNLFWLNFAEECLKDVLLSGYSIWEWFQDPELAPIDCMCFAAGICMKATLWSQLLENQSFLLLHKEGTTFYFRKQIKQPPTVEFDLSYLAYVSYLHYNGLKILSRLNIIVWTMSLVWLCESKMCWSNFWNATLFCSQTSGKMAEEGKSRQKNVLPDTLKGHALADKYKFINYDEVSGIC